MTQRLDSTLVQQAQAGDTAARDQLFVTLTPILRAFFIKRIGDKSEVDDLIQNTLLRVHRGLQALKNTDRLKSFTMKAALYELQDLYRGRYHPKEILIEPDMRPGGPPRHPQLDTQIDLERALDQLSPKARRILELREYGYRYEEIAEMLDTTEAAIKMQVKRAFTKLRNALISLFLLGFFPAGSP